MPHLTRTASGTSATDLRVGFGIPGFAHPLVAPSNGPN
ncbi:Phage tail protein OS=Streptomyces alboniger OX=132473 GN=CP975_23525 PE=4 SV=1 [Streptomyces alboniger]